jgi:hypothetical protein
MGVRWRRTVPVLKGPASAWPLIDPRPTYIVAVVMGKVCLKIRNSVRGCVQEDITQQSARGTTIKDRGEGRILRERIHQTLVEILNAKVNNAVLQGLVGCKRLTLSLILAPLDAMRAGMIEGSTDADEMVEQTHPRPNRLLRCPSCRATGQNVH